MADDEVAMLKRELEALKLLLEHERNKNAAGQDDDGDIKQELLKPERGAIERDESTMSRRRGGGKKAALSSKEIREYVQHAAVGDRRGKWWLRDRLVLSRATPDEDGAVTLKVRENWVWGGRTVLLDKIIRLNEEKQEEEQLVEMKQEKPQLEKEDPTCPDTTSKMPLPCPVEVPVTQSEVTSPAVEAPEPSEAADAAREGAVDSKVAEEQSPRAKADDDVRESSAPAAAERSPPVS